MPEFTSKWLNYLETRQDSTDKTDKSPSVTSGAPPNRYMVGGDSADRPHTPDIPATRGTPDGRNSQNSRDNGSQTSENLCHVAPLNLPFPLGYQGLPVRSVRAALAWCDAKEITDPLEVMWTVCLWVLDHFKMVKYRGPLYQKVRERERQLWTDLTGSDDDPYCDECPGIHDA